MNKQHRNWIVDFIFWLGFLAAFFLDLTGVELHQWLGMVLGAYALYHLVLHWSWVQAVTSRFFGKTTTQARLYYLVDAGLALGFLEMILTGVVISTWLNLPLENYIVWRDAHVLVSGTTLALLVLKVALHARWIVNTAKNMLAPALKPQPAPVAQGDRRYVLALMGITTAAAGVALLNALDVTNPVQASASAEPQADSGTGQAQADSPTSVPTLVSAAASATPTAASTATAASAVAKATGTATAAVARATSTPAAVAKATSTPAAAASSGSSCAVRCNKRCAYPGRCRKYVDANKNSKCDYGECA